MRAEPNTAFVFLKILWECGCFKHSQGTRQKYTYDEMMIMAMKSDYKKAFSPNLPSLVAPESMLTSIRTALGEENLSLANMLKSVYISLAKSYDKAIKDIEKYAESKSRTSLSSAAEAKINTSTGTDGGNHRAKVFTALLRYALSKYRRTDYV